MRIAAWRRFIGMAFFWAMASLQGTAARAADDIVVGQIGPFTVLPAPDAHELNAGIKACLAQVNARGGVGGRRISFFELDDTYSPDGYVKQFEVAMQRKPVALLSPVGSALLARALKDKLLDKHDVVVINAVPGAEVNRDPGHPRLFHVRAGDRQQIEKIVRHARTLGIARMHVVYQNLPIGASGWAMAQAASRAEGGKLAVQGLESAHDGAALAGAAKQVAASDTQSVLVIGAPKFMADAIHQLRLAGVTQWAFALSYMPAGLVHQLAGEAGARGVSIAQAIPNPNGVATPLNREFAAAMKALDPKLTTYTAFHLEGYLSARVLVEGLRRASSPTPEALAKALKSTGEMDFGGFRVDFSKANTGSQYVDIGVVTSGGKLMY
ncbi:MAG TPA: ABC transporter substrate-binding protein [Ottowia sp.]|nr:ABC transporter substrate-binding protein [Ottowia sp.]